MEVTKKEMVDWVDSRWHEEFYNPPKTIIFEHDYEISKSLISLIEKYGPEEKKNGSDEERNEGMG